MIERDHLMLANAQAQGVPTIEGDARRPGCCGRRHRQRAAARRRDSRQFPARRIVEWRASSTPASTWWCAPTSESEFKALEALGAGRVVMGERELARGMLEYSLRSLGVPQNARAPSRAATCQ